MSNDSTEAASPAQTLSAITTEVTACKPHDTGAALLLLWAGVVVTRWCSLAIASDPRWAPRQQHSEFAEAALARALRQSSVLRERDTTLPTRTSNITSLGKAEAEVAVAEIIKFTEAALELLELISAGKQNKPVDFHDIQVSLRMLHAAWTKGEL
ncbi:hypothetical protein [Amycolatopsis sp. NPDC003731]